MLGHGPFFKVAAAGVAFWISGQYFTCYAAICRRTDNMIAIEFVSPADLCRAVAERARQARLAADLSQQGLAERAGVSLGSLKRFERTGAASLDCVARLAVALRLEGGFEDLFRPPRFTTIDQVIAAPKPRRRGRGK